MTSKRQNRFLPRRRPEFNRRQILVFTEGERTEDGYLVHWRREFRERVLVNVDPFHGGPLQLVDRAAATKRREAHEQKRGRGRAHDEYWCVFDVDRHPNINQAIDKALANSIHVVVSNPCIELWFILHFQSQTAYITRSRAQELSRKLLKCEKTLAPAALRDLTREHETARTRAKALDLKHALDGSPPRSNPSSNMWQLIDQIRGVSE